MALERKELPAGLLLTAAIVIALAAGTGAWFMIPDPQTEHRFASPSGRTALHVNEYCDEAGCMRRIVAEFTAADGSATRRGCAVDLAGDTPLFSNASPIWAADEQSVELVYAASNGAGRKLPLNLQHDCTLTE